MEWSATSVTNTILEEIHALLFQGTLKVLLLNAWMSARFVQMFTRRSMGWYLLLNPSNWTEYVYHTLTLYAWEVSAPNTVQWMKGQGRNTGYAHNPSRINSELIAIFLPGANTYTIHIHVASCWSFSNYCTSIMGCTVSLTGQVTCT